MTVADGFGMLAVGLCTIVIGGTIIYLVINKIEKDKKKEQEGKKPLPWQG
jgi:hypothetical protein